MSENMEYALEHVIAGVLFCMAVAMLLWLHGVFLQQVSFAGRASEQLILVEQSEGQEWNRLDEP